ncbi:Pectinesterase 3 [Apostasia shenzhenica]|uniref:Pectinesterase n=1 Tax=Apostasia shenzhenica TaxID=1088818 RepID=A0A2I0A1Y5_9ASPA|nr:Pectinesterase 3 [Apostasia shenzhenica]
MDTMKSFKGYDKVDPTEERSFRRRNRKRIILIAIAGVLLVAIVAGVAVGVAVNKGSRSDGGIPPSPFSASNPIKAICSVTRYPDSCFSSLSSANASVIATGDPKELFKLSLAVAASAIQELSPFLDALKLPAADKRLQAAVNDCRELFEDAVDRLNDSAASLAAAKPGEKLFSERRISDLRTWLSAAVADQETCLDGFEGTAGSFREKLEAAMVNSTRFTSNSLAIATGILGIMEKLSSPFHRKLLGSTSQKSPFPAWLSAKQRRVLLESGELPANVTVAQDGSGQAKTIQEAVNLVPKKSNSLFVIYIKAGVYRENVLLDNTKWNVVFLGDGMYKTIITGDKNYIDGTPTFETATFVVTGRGFVAKNIGFKNTAGPDKHQAVALRSGADRSIFFRCSFDGFQDTLYAHSNRQFYRECDIIGTIDFIFGDASVILQNCRILPRQPLPNQMNTITAQGKKDPHESTGISIQGCTIAPYDSVTRPTYLGRPWKNYSTTVVMKTEIGGVVDPAGWLPWVLGTVPPETVNYAEYQNTGPGSGLAGRVTWPSYRPAVDAHEASKYTVGPFINGHEWIPGAGVQFDSNL